jgi:hypothetical protein
MKPIYLILFLCSACAIDRLVDRIEYPVSQVWWNYKDLRVIQVDNYKYHQRITAVAGSPFPKYSYCWNEYVDSCYVGQIIALTDSLRSQLHYKKNWKKL